MDRRLFENSLRITWILIGHRSGARLYSSWAANGPLSLVKEFIFPDGRRQNHEIDSDAQGRRYNSGADRRSRHGDRMKHGLDPHTESVEHLADTFAQQLTGFLRDGRTHRQFNDLVLIAEPGFLGKLCLFLDGETKKRVKEIVHQNWSQVFDDELARKVHGVLLNVASSSDSLDAVSIRGLGK